MRRNTRLALALVAALWVGPLAAQGIGPSTCSISGGTITCPGGTLSPATSTLTSAHIFVGSVGGVATDRALSGDATLGNTGVLTFNSVNGNVGTFGSATQAPVFTVNAKGLITAASNITVVPAVGSITGLGTGVAIALGINVGSAGAPVLFNGALGTPSSGTATNLTGLPIAGLTGLGTSVATALGTNVGSAGAFVVNGGALGTPSSGTATNLTGLPIAGLTGLGTNVATALGVNVGSAGAFVVNGGALGTPLSGVGTNLTGTASSLTAGNVSGTGVGSLTSLALGGCTISTHSTCIQGTARHIGVVTFDAIPVFSAGINGAANNAGTIPGSSLANATVQAAQIANATITTTQIAAATVANSNLVNMVTATIKCRNTASTGAPEDCTAAQAAGITGYGNGATLNTTTAQNPTGTTSTTFVMMGLGGTCAITPAKSSRVLVTIYGDGAHSVNNGLAAALIAFGTGTAPTNGAALTGTVVSGTIVANPTGTLSASYTAAFSIPAVITGLTPGTAIWIDTQLKVVGAGTATLTNVSCTAIEI